MLLEALSCSSFISQYFDLIADNQRPMSSSHAHLTPSPSWRPSRELVARPDNSSAIGGSMKSRIHPAFLATTRFVGRGAVAGIAALMLLWLIVGCASTQHGKVPVQKLTDSQLVEELASAERELGIQTDRRGALLAIDTSPRPVVTGATTTFSGTVNAQYNRANQTLYGSFAGSGYTTYHTMDANAGARLAQSIGLIINNANRAKLEGRRREVLTEITNRRNAREGFERVTSQFLAAHPEVASNRDLLIACLLITRQRTPDPLAQLQQAGEIMSTLPENRWIGWVEAHGIPDYPYGVVAGSYFMDTTWQGDTLTGSGKGSDGLEMSLTATRQPDGSLKGRVWSKAIEATFVGQMNESGLCMDYVGTNTGNPIRGITWAFRRPR